MRKYRLDKTLRPSYTRSKRRPAFSLAELVVSVGILVLMLSLAGQVFTLTIKSTGQALALTETSQLLRALEETLREDLRHVQPGRSVILIQGNPVNAYWSQAGREADDDSDPANGYAHVSDPTREDEKGNLVKPRADLLVLFTTRRGRTFSHATTHPDLASNVQQVVYGHAELGEYVPDPGSGGDPYVFEPGPEAFPIDATTEYASSTAVSQMPADGWHLGRRGVLLVPGDTSRVPTAEWKAATLSASDLDDLLAGKTDVIGSLDYEAHVLTPGVVGPWYLPSIIDRENPIPRSRMDVTPPPLYANRLAHYLLPRCASFKVEWALDSRSEFVAGRLDNADEVIWVDPGNFDTSDPNVHALAELDRSIETANKLDVQGDQGARDKRVALCDLMGMPRSHPDGLIGNLDPPGYSLADRFVGRDLDLSACNRPAWARDPERWWEPLASFVAGGSGRGVPANLVAFGAARRHLGPDGQAGTADDRFVAEDIFPNALRITVDVYDDELRLDRPIRHVMVIPVGG